MNELKNIDIHIISLVDKGANKKNIIWKSNDSGSHTYNRTIAIQKTNEDKRIVYGIVYSPNQEDAHGDFATESEIEKACYNFMRKSKTDAIDTQHDLDTNKNCFIGESWIVKNNDAFFPEEVGGWAVGIKVENDEIWKSVKSGELTGISMYGYAEKVEKNSDEQIEKGVVNFFKKMFAKDSDNSEVCKDFNDRIVMLDFPKLLDALHSAAYDVLYDENITDKTAGILLCIEQFKEHIASIEKSKELAKSGKMISDSNMKKLQTAVESLQAILDAANKSTEKKKEFKNKKTSTKENQEMTAEEIQKKIDDALKPVKDENEQLKKDNEELKQKLEKSSSGSAQVHDEGKNEGKEEVKKVFPWATLGAR